MADSNQRPQWESISNLVKSDKYIDGEISSENKVMHLAQSLIEAKEAGGLDEKS